MNIIALAILVTIIGALPFGLVNLTVLDVSYRDGNRHAMRIANGAAWVEVLFGLLAITYLNTRHLLKVDSLTVVLFISGIWLGKMGVLWIYSAFSHKILSRSKFLAQNMNRIIGSLLLIIVVIQLLK